MEEWQDLGEMKQEMEKDETKLLITNIMAASHGK
jgi:hypothetical protein